MIVSIMTIKLYASWVHSLKEKRMIVNSICNKLKNKFNISIIESDEQDLHQTIVISIAYLSANKALSHSISEKIISFTETNTEATIINITHEDL
ncbi:DUF503 domain-containing protein [Anaerovorax odorimutans]|uniref:DUF503 domain-containing protein n=1 Tax=Anaerovorax odorimutans TaxID=109327 RepID=UPI0004046133|nr:DUF503 domain-containing protein [Anaerovorax odorimutans]